MKCRNCETHIIADAEGDWMHTPTYADRPCDDPERPTETDEAVLAWLGDAADHWEPGASSWPPPAPEGVRELWLELPTDDPHASPTTVRLRAVLEDGTALTVTRDLTGRTLEAS